MVALLWSQLVHVTAAVYFMALYNGSPSAAVAVAECSMIGFIVAYFGQTVQA